MTICTSTYFNSPPFSDDEILIAAAAVGIDDNGQRCMFKVGDIQRHLLQSRGVTNGSNPWMKKEDILSGEKVSAVLRRRPEIFNTVRTGRRIIGFYIVGGVDV